MQGRPLLLRVADLHSACQELGSGMSQCSVLELLLFRLFTNESPQVVRYLHLIYAAYLPDIQRTGKPKKIAGDPRRPWPVIGDMAVASEPREIGIVDA